MPGKTKEIKKLLAELAQVIDTEWQSCRDKHDPMYESVSSRSSLGRRRKARQLSYEFKLGDKDAAWRLQCRYRALKGIELAGPLAIEERLRKANAARRRNLDSRKRVAFDLAQVAHELENARRLLGSTRQQ